MVCLSLWQVCTLFEAAARSHSVFSRALLHVHTLSEATSDATLSHCSIDCLRPRNPDIVLGRIMGRRIGVLEVPRRHQEQVGCARDLFAYHVYYGLDRRRISLGRVAPAPAHRVWASTYPGLKSPRGAYIRNFRHGAHIYGIGKRVQETRPECRNAHLGCETANQVVCCFKNKTEYHEGFGCRYDRLTKEQRAPRMSLQGAAAVVFVALVEGRRVGSEVLRIWSSYAQA